MWLLFAFCGPVCWAVSTHIDKYLVDRYFRDSDPAILMLFTALLGVVLLPFIWWVEPSILKPPLRAIAVMTASGVLYMGAILFYLRAIQSEEASVVAPLFQASTLFTFLLAFFFLHERLGVMQLLGGGMVVGGALSLSLGGELRAKRFKWRLMTLMLAATFVLALASVLFKYFAIQDDFWTTTFWTFAGEGVFGALLLLNTNYRRQFGELFRQNPGAVVGVNAANELINLGGGLSVRYASLLAPVALVSAISSTTTIFVFAFGILLTLFLPKFGRENLSAGNFTRKALGAFLIAGGVILIEVR
ncbi:MAG TPA: EamA family transporter [Rhizomicrobium sp.]|nr:EamA family transporter [Rhizomicrobium sp.]